MASDPVGSDQLDDRLAEHFFRHQYGALVSRLCRVAGASSVEQVEDAVQDALMRAMQTWPRTGVPRQPAAWLHRVAHNRLIDQLRRAGREVPDADAIIDQLQQADEAAEWSDAAALESRLPDDQLRMMFVCCDQRLDIETQIMLILKDLAGFGLQEISTALLYPVEHVKKRLQRARKKWKNGNWPTTLPDPSALAARLDSVHRALYLIFNEGYYTTQGDLPLREALCEDAARLCHILCNHPVGSVESKALLSLMLFHAARFDARVNDTGDVINLDQQDRSRWDKALIAQGHRWFKNSECKQPGIYHLEAAIAAFHASSPSLESTNWQAITTLYDRLLSIGGRQAIHQLNHAIALGFSGKPKEGLTLLTALHESGETVDVTLLGCATAKLLELNNEKSAAVAAYQSLLQRPLAEHQRRCIESNVRRIGA